MIVIHPLILELFLMSARAGYLAQGMEFYRKTTATENDDVRNNITVSLINASVLEFALIFVKRSLMMSMRSTYMSTIAIIISGLEEIILRVTITQRDKFCQSYILGGGDRHASDAGKTSEKRQQARSVQNYIWGTSISLAMIFEVTAICTRFSAVHLLKPHRSIFMLGFDGAEESETAMMTFNFALEIVSELL